jgi:hypothetical protein
MAVGAAPCPGTSHQPEHESFIGASICPALAGARGRFDARAHGLDAPSHAGAMSASSDSAPAVPGVTDDAL